MPNFTTLERWQSQISRLVFRFNCLARGVFPTCSYPLSKQHLQYALLLSTEAQVELEMRKSGINIPWLNGEQEVALRSAFS